MSNDLKNEELIRDSIDELRLQNWQIKSDNSGGANTANGIVNGVDAPLIHKNI